MSLLNDLAFGKHCDVCNVERTRRTIDSKRVCIECARKIAFSEEGVRSCPIDNEALTKIEKSDIFIDFCPKCHGVWLDKGELEAIEEKAAQEGSGFATGMLVGIGLS